MTVWTRRNRPTARAPATDVVAHDAGPAASLRDVRKSYGRTIALDGIDLEIPRGEITCLLGPNGAGKTTAFSLLTGLRRPDSGTVRLLGGSPRDPAVRRLLGATPQEAQFPSTLRVREIVALVRAHFPDARPLGPLLDLFGLEALRDKQAGGLSGGERRRLAVALAFVAEPRLVVLDEPTAGLDVRARRLVWEAARSYVAGGGTILFTTHYLEEAEALATQVVVLSGGRVAASGTVDAIVAAAGVAQIRIPQQPLPPLEGLLRVEAHEHGAQVLYVEDAPGALRALVACSADLDGIQVRPASLEEAFIAIVETDAR